MLIVLIPIVWLTIIAIVVAACWSAARGDEMLARPTSGALQRDSRIATSRRAAWTDGPVLTGTRHAGRVGVASRSRVRGVRTRGGHCTTGH
jgi:hypothetical protein